MQWQTGQDENAKPWREYAKVDTSGICTRVVWGTADREEYSERLILRSVKQLILFGNQNVDLVW